MRVPQRGHGCPPFMWTARKSRTCVSNVGGTRSRRTSIAVDSVDASRCTARRPPRPPARALAERQQPRRMEDLVAVRVADARRRTPGCAGGSSARPDGGGSDRATPRASTPGHRLPVPSRRAETRHDALDTGRQEIDLAHLGRVPVADLRRRVVRRQPVRALRPRCGLEATRPPRGPNPRITAVFDGALTAGPASWKRPVSIGFTTIRSRSRSIARNLPCLRIAVTRLTDERLELGRRAAHGKRPGSRRRRDRAAPERGVEGFRDHGQIG